MNGIIDLSPFQLIVAYFFIIVLLAIVGKLKLKREQEIIIASFRMTLQLFLMGFLLVRIFNTPHPLLSLLMIAIMEGFAIYNIFKRIKQPLTSQLKKHITFSIVIGPLLSLFYFIFIIVRVTPWFSPQYFIPIMGMLLGNAMTGITLSAKRLIEGFKDNKSHVEVALMLGATPREASKDIILSAFDASILPTINSMMGMGIISLPGMMTGQILAGAPPIMAIKYQIAIMLGIAGSVALTNIIFVQLGYKSFFNNRAQLKN